MPQKDLHINLSTYFSLRIIISLLLFLQIFQSGQIFCQQIPNFGQACTPTPDIFDTSHCILWFKADEYDTSNLSSIPVLHDYSGNNHHAVQATTNRQPLFIQNGFGTKPAIRFDGVDDYLKSAISVTGNKLTAFYILKVLSITTYNGFITLYNSAEPQDWNTPSALVMALHFNNPDKLAAHRNGNSYGYTLSFLQSTSICSIILRNDSTLTFSNNQGYTKTSSPWPLNSNNIVIGSRWESNALYRFGNFEFAELIIFDTCLNSSSYNEVYNYLFDKYSLPAVSLGPDINQQYSLCPVAFSLDTNYASYLWSTGDTVPQITVNQPGSYWVKVKDKVFGFYSYDTINIGLPGFNLPDLVICPGDTINVQAGFEGSYTYKWSNPLNDSLSGEPAFALTDSGTFWVRVTDSLGCSLIDTFDVARDPFYDAVQFQSDTLLFCEGDILEITLPAGQVYQYLWSNGSVSPAVQLNAEGLYSVTVTNESGCKSSGSVFIRFKGFKPFAWFICPDSVCLNSVISLSDSSYLNPSDTNSEIVSWQWTYNMNTVSTDSSFQLSIEDPLINTYHLLITTTSGCQAEVSRSVFSVPPPRILFNTRAGCTGTATCFSDQSYDTISPIFIRSWNFGDPQSGQSNTSADSSVCHNYQYEDLYPVILEVGNVFGCTDSLIKTINIHQSTALGFIHMDSCSSHSVQFTDTSTYSAWNPCINRLWDWGDGHFDSIPYPSHLFAGSGNYNVTLRSTTLQCRNTVTKTVFIHPLPSSLFNASDLCAGVETEFTDLSQVPGDSIINHYWQFDSLGNSQVVNPHFVFPYPGNFTISLEVISSGGCINDTSFNITVFDRPAASFIYTIDPLDEGFEACFTNQSSQAVSYYWDFGDSSYSNLTSPCHIYEFEDTVTIMLVATNTQICSDTAYSLLSVSPAIMDLSLDDFNIEKINDRFELQISVTNLSNRYWNNLFFNLDKDGQQFYWFDIDTTLAPMENLFFRQFLPEFFVTSEASKYICARTGNQSIKEANISNNDLCKNFSNLPELIKYIISPTSIDMDFIIPEIDFLNFNLYSIDGRHIISREYNKPASGYFQVSLGVTGLSPGIYILEISNPNNVKKIKLFIGGK